MKPVQNYALLTFTQGGQHEQAHTAPTSAVSVNGDAIRVAPEIADVALDPFQSLHLVQHPIIPSQQAAGGRQKSYKKRS